MPTLTHVMYMWCWSSISKTCSLLLWFLTLCCDCCQNYFGQTQSRFFFYRQVWATFLQLSFVSSYKLCLQRSGHWQNWAPMLTHVICWSMTGFNCALRHTLVFIRNSLLCEVLSRHMKTELRKSQENIQQEQHIDLAAVQSVIHLLLCVRLLTESCRLVHACACFFM